MTTEPTNTLWKIHWVTRSGNSTSSETAYYEHYDQMFTALMDFALQQARNQTGGDHHKLQRLRMWATHRLGSKAETASTVVDIKLYRYESGKWIQCKWNLTEPYLQVDYS